MDHYWKSVEGWAAFSGLYIEMVRRASPVIPSHFVEVGSWLGRSAALMGVEIINSHKPIMLDCIDPWTDGGPDLKDTAYFKSLKETPFALFQRNTKPVSHVVNAIRGTSMEAVHRYTNGSIDFLMLDGDHSYEAVRDEIAAYLPKMRPGGLMSGDDYLWPGVKQAVDEALGDKAQHVIVREHTNVLMSASYWTFNIPAAPL